VFEEERRLAADLTASLERLGDRVGTYGFYSRGKDAVRFLRIKEFDARFDCAAKCRLGSVQPSGFTRLGAAMRHGAYVLESRALAKNMILLAIGDGLPYAWWAWEYVRRPIRRCCRIPGRRRRFGLSGTAETFTGISEDYYSTHWPLPAATAGAGSC
jgi:nitric oxide reductase activation protein